METTVKTNKNNNFEIGKVSREGLTWGEAKKYAEKQGMRLPTRAELFVMIEQGVEIPDWCWTCEEYDAATAWYVFAAVIEGDDDKCNKHYAVPVRDIKA